MDKVSLEGMVFYGYHGTGQEERKIGQRFLVDVDLYGDFEEAGREDNLSKAVNYAEVFEIVKKIVEGKPFQLLEGLARRLCGALLEKFPGVEKVSVRVRKPHVPIQGVLKAAGVEMTRSRNN